MSGYTVERVTKEIGDLQVSVNGLLTDLAQRLREESNKLAEIRMAIETERARLKELHDIDASMVSLKAILEVAAESREALEAELARKEAELASVMEQKNEEWKREIIQHEAKTKEAREREEEQYAYKLALKRRKEADEYEIQKSALQVALREQREQAERELEARRGTLAAREKEIEDLKARVERFPQELAAATKQADQAARLEVQKQAELDARLAKLESDAAKNVTALKIAGLEDLVKRQAAQVEALNKQLSLAQAQVQAMAVKAIEGAAGLKSTPGE
jgi:chromosome segregation ATPase